jgi:phytanoyl-CoA hydroxylase
MELSNEYCECFREDGYVVWPKLLDPASDLGPVIEEYSVATDRLLRTLDPDGANHAAHNGASLQEKLIQLVEHSGSEHLRGLDISLPGAFTKADTPIHLGDEVFRLLTNPALLDAVESIIGPEILLHPVQHTRIKVPEHKLPNEEKTSALTSSTPWHQDLAVIDRSADHTDMLTVWIPTTSSTTESGCVVVLPKRHKGGLLEHRIDYEGNKGLHIPGQYLSGELSGEEVHLEMEPGDVLFIHRNLPHRSEPNTSDHVRMSMDVRYCPIGQNIGRDWAPNFVVRSRRIPAEIVDDPAVWRDLWLATRDDLVKSPPTVFRWPETTGGRHDENVG